MADRIRFAVLGFLLHRANSSPPMVARREFYDLKDRLLDRYARRVGADVQEIERECWGPWGSYHCPGADCSRCEGTGVFERVWILLHRYEWGPYVFHRPGQRTWTRPARVDIRGRIQHRRYGRSSAEACLWLYVFTGEWALLRRALRNQRRYGWWAWPLLNLQRLVFELGRRGRASRRPRRTSSTVRSDIHSEELPF